MQYRFRPLRLRDALAVARWRYEGIYAHYNVSHAAILTVWGVQRLLRFVGVDTYYAVFDEEQHLVGVFSFYPREEHTIEVGLGLRPDMTGHGVGLAFVEAGLTFARQQYQPRFFQLDVAAFNERARLVYERAGFKPTGTLKRKMHGITHDYIQMSRPA